MKSKIHIIPMSPEVKEDKGLCYIGSPSRNLWWWKFQTSGLAFIVRETLNKWAKLSRETITEQVWFWKVPLSISGMKLSKEEEKTRECNWGERRLRKRVDIEKFSVMSRGKSGNQISSTICPSWLFCKNFAPSSYNFQRRGLRLGRLNLMSEISYPSSHSTSSSTSRHAWSAHDTLRMLL